MKAKIYLLLIIFSLTLGVKAGDFTKEENIDAFTKISCSSGVDVELVKSTEHKIKMEAEEQEDLDEIKFEVKDGELHVWRKNKSGMTIFNTRNKVNIMVSYTSLEKIQASSGSDIVSQAPVESDKLHVGASSGADIVLDINANKLGVDASSGADISLKIKTAEVKVSTSSGADIRLKGSTKDAYMSSSSGADIEAFGLEAENATANSSSAGDIELTVLKFLKATASSGGDVTYRGDARIQKSTSSGGDVEKD
jgi:hypothetical protein